MIEGFDREIDSLLRQTAQRETIVFNEFNAHLDADDISLFVENVLSEKARLRVTEHLADCAKCRKILATVISFNDDEASEIVHAEEAKIAVSETPIPWYRKLFAFPQLAYAMGGLAVVMAGMVGFVALQNFKNTDSSVAQIEKTAERPRNAGGVSSDGAAVETYSPNTYSNSASVSNTPTMNSANIAANTTAKSGAPLPPSTALNTNASVSAQKQNPVQAEPPPPEESDAAKAKKEAENKTQTDDSVSAPEVRRERFEQNAAIPNQSANQTAQSSSSLRSVQTARRIQNLPMNARAMPTSPVTPAQTEEQRTSGAPAVKSADKKDDSESSKSVGGKSFIRKDGVWYDKSYNQQKTVNVRRNSDDYKKLDSGLRSIADNLGGTVVIVWRGTSYRIQ